MKNLFLIFTLFACSVSIANPDPELLKIRLEQQPDCGGVVRFDDNFLFIGYGPYKIGLKEPREPIPGKMRVVSISEGTVFDLFTKDSVVDVVTIDDRAFVLTYSAIEEWDLTSQQRLGVYETYEYEGQKAHYEHAQGMVLYDNQLIIAHGRLGVSVFNIRNRRIVKQFRLIPQQAPLESMARDIVAVGSTAYVVMDNYHLIVPAPFRGIIEIDLKTQEVIREMSGLDPGVTSVNADSQVLIANYGGNPIWKYYRGSFKSNKLPKPALQMVVFPDRGRPTGKWAVDEKYIYTCFMTPPKYDRKPRAFERKKYLLN